MSTITLTCVTLSLRECPFLWETTFPMHTTRMKLESLKIQGKDFMVVIAPLVGVFVVAMVARIPKASR